MRNILNNHVVYVVPTGAHKALYLKEKLINPLENAGAVVWIMPTDMAKSIIPEYEKFKLEYNVKDNFSSQTNWLVPEEEIVVVAPCSFDTFNKLAYGIADNYALSIVHSAIGKGKKIIIAPAMDRSLWENFNTKECFERLSKQPNISIIYPEVFHDENGNVVKISMAPYEKVFDGVVRNFITIKYNQKKKKGNINHIREMYFPHIKGIGAKLAEERLTSGKAGFIAIKISEGILTTSTTSEVGNLKPCDLTLVTDVKKGMVYWIGDKAPTSEFPLVYEIFSATNKTTLIHGHCSKITYNPKMEKYLTNKYIPFGTWKTTGPILDVLSKYDGFAIMRLHGEIVLADSLEEAFCKYWEMSSV